MSRLARDEVDGFVQAFELPATGKTVALAVTTSSGATAAFVNRGVYRFLSDNDCFVALGASSVVTDMKLVGGVPEYFYLKIDDTVAGITASGTAALAITLC